MMLRVPPFTGLPVLLSEIFEYPEVVLGALDWLLLGVPPLLLPPQAVATVAQIASPATAVSPRLCVCIDTLLIAEDALRFVVAFRRTANQATDETASGINLRLLSAPGNAGYSASINRDQTVTIVSPPRCTPVMQLARTGRSRQSL